MPKADVRTLIIDIEDSWSPLGLWLHYRVKGEKQEHVTISPDMAGFDTVDGQRYRVTFERLPNYRGRSRDPYAKKCSDCGKMKRGHGRSCCRTKKRDARGEIVTKWVCNDCWSRGGPLGVGHYRRKHRHLAKERETWLRKEHPQNFADYDREN
jgi:hypothetical protein